MSKTVTAGVTLAALCYPVLVYFSLPQLGVSALAMVLLVLAGVRFILSNSWGQPSAYLLPGAIALICAAAVVLRDPLYIKLYPALMNFSVGLTFAYSLTREKTLIQHFAERFNPAEAARPEVQSYLRNLTLAWALLLFANTLVAAYTAGYSSTEFWALYNCFISYLVMAAFFVLELAFRHLYRRRHFNHGSGTP